MSSQLGSTRTRTATAHLRRPAVPAAAFLAWVVLLNGAVNSLLADFGSTLPVVGSGYAVTLPLGEVGAGLVSVASVALAAAALAWFVRSVGGTDDSGLVPVPATRHLGRYGRAAVVAGGGTLAAVAGLVVFVLPGLVVLVYLPFVFVAVALDGEPVRGAVASSHERITSRPLTVTATALGMALATAGLCVGGAATSLLPPTVEFAVGTAATAVVVLAGTYLLTGLYRRLPDEPSPDVGRL
jgi:hypothetical protein